jgi:hypothetical protein
LQGLEVGLLVELADFLLKTSLKVYKSSFMRECENKVIGTIRKRDRTCHLIHFVIDFR